MKRNQKPLDFLFLLRSATRINKSLRSSFAKDPETFKDKIALVIMILCFYLISRGINHTVSGVTLVTVGYYFRKRGEFKQPKNKKK